MDQVLSITLPLTKRTARKGLFCSFSNPFYQWCDPAQNGDHTICYEMLSSDAWKTALLKAQIVALQPVAEVITQVMLVCDVEK